MDSTLADRTEMEIDERRLRPLYDAIDGRSYKTAIKTADALLKVRPGAVQVGVGKHAAAEEGSNGRQRCHMSC